MFKSKKKKRNLIKNLCDEALRGRERERDRGFGES